MLSNEMPSSHRFSTRALYLQVRDALARRISSGEWKPGNAIPNESDLAREFGVSSGTMRKALDLMEAERLLTRRQGRGTFVNDQSSDELTVRYSNVRAPDGERIVGEVMATEATEGTANEAECVRLRLRAHERVYRVRRLRSYQGQAFMLEDVAMPASLFAGLDIKGVFSHRIVVLAQQFGILLGKAEERVSIGAASPVAAEALGIGAGTPIMVLDRLVMNLDGRPVEWRKGQVHLGDRHYLAEMS